MRANSIMMVVLAAVFGLVAVVLANLWLDGQRSALAKGSEIPQDTVVVAAFPLKFGDQVTADNLREIAWPAGAVPAGAFKTIEEVFEIEGQRQALQSIGANEPLLAAKITGPGQRATLSAVLADGMKAVSIRVNDVLGVAGFVFPGDRVDVLLTRNIRNQDGSEQSYVDVLLQSVKVLAVDQFADEARENPTVVKAVTLEVTTTDAQKLTLAAGAGQLSLALRQVASDDGEQTERVTLADLTGETPYDAAMRQAADEQLKDIRQVVENIGDRIDKRVGSVEDQISKLKQPEAPAEPEVREVEVVKYVEPEPPAFATVRVYRGLDPPMYDVPRER